MIAKLSKEQKNLKSLIMFLTVKMVNVADESATPQSYRLSAVTLSGRVSVTATSGKGGSSYLMFTGCRLNENKLRDLLQECVPVMSTPYRGPFRA